MNKNIRQKNLAVLFFLFLIIFILFGVGFCRINGANVPQKKKTVFQGINFLLTNEKK